jgi:hypothetical protein
LSSSRKWRPITREDNTIKAPGTKKDDRVLAMAFALRCWAHKLRPRLVANKQTRSAVEARSKLVITDQVFLFNQNTLDGFFKAKQMIRYRATGALRAQGDVREDDDNGSSLYAVPRYRSPMQRAARRSHGTAKDDPAEPMPALRLLLSRSSGRRCGLHAQHPVRQRPSRSRSVARGVMDGSEVSRRGSRPRCRRLRRGGLWPAEDHQPQRRAPV